MNSFGCLRFPMTYTRVLHTVKFKLEESLHEAFNITIEKKLIERVSARSLPYKKLLEINGKFALKLSIPCI